MSPLVILVLLPSLLISYVLFKPRWLAHKRAKIKAVAFPKQWRSILKHNVPSFYKMPADLQLQLKQHIQVFLAEKTFIGFEGVKITDEIRVTIAAQACLLLLNKPSNYYPKLKSIYVYPAAFISQQNHLDKAGVLQSQKRVHSGESWDFGKVVLSWRDSKAGGQIDNDGHNLVIHEFAHQLDQETGSANGAPFLPNKKRRAWSVIFMREYSKLNEAIDKGEDPLLDPYGATNPAEFFACASEVFFEKPKALNKLHAELYSQLRDFYCVDPVVWS